MSSLRCRKCHQLQYKYKVKGNQLVIETKCYNCNTYNYLKINLNQLTNKYENTKYINQKNHVSIT